MYGSEFKIELNTLSELEETNSIDLSYLDLDVDESLPIFKIDLDDPNIGAYFYVAGVISKKIKDITNCKMCDEKYQNQKKSFFDKDIEFYVKNIDRGKLCYPSNDLLHIIFTCVKLFVIKIIPILKRNNSKVKTSSLINIFKSLLDDLGLNRFIIDCLACNFEAHKILHLICVTLSKILLNNYSKIENNLIQEKKKFKPSSESK